MLKNKKCLLFFTISLVLLLSMAVVSAADDASTDVLDAQINTIESVDTATANDNAIDVKEEKSNDGYINDNSVSTVKSVTKQDTIDKVTKANYVNVQNVSSYDDLQYWIHYINIMSVGAQDLTLNLFPGDYNATKGNITWGIPDTPKDKKLTINGNGLVLDGGNTYNFITVCVGTTLELNNITFTNYQSTDYTCPTPLSTVIIPLDNNGAVIHNNGTIIVNNCTFINNHATKKGGVIYSEDGDVIINSTNFIRNKADVDGASIYTLRSTVSISSSNFTNNTADYSGGALYNNEGTATVTDCNFIGNNGTTYGGGALVSVLDAGTLSVSDSKFIENYANMGGAIYTTSTLNIDDCRFESNSANYGGAIYTTENPTISISSSTFIENEAIDGGAIYNNAGANTTTMETSFTRNTARGNGGAIYNKGTDNTRNGILKISSRFMDNNAVIGGAIYNYRGSLFIENIGIFVNNTASECGGAIYHEGLTSRQSVKDLSLINCIFSDNVAYDNGGAFDGFISEKAIVDNCLFERNFASGAGAIDNLISSGTMKITNCEFLSNSATYYSAVMALCYINLDNCYFYNNTAYDDGGAVSHMISENDGKKYSNITNTTFINNTSYGNGAAIGNLGLYYISACNFSGNTAKKGGAIYLETGNLTIENCYFTDNTATYGGAIYHNIDFENIKITTSNFTNNYASIYGGAIYAESIIVNQTNFTSNNASLSGGAIYSTDAMTILESNFTSNNALRINGGAIYGKIAIVKQNNFINNTAANVAGAIYLTDNRSEIETNVLRENTPENFVIENNKINLVRKNNLFDINTDTVDIYVYDETADELINIYTGSLDNFVVPNGQIIYLNASNNMFILEPVYGGDYFVHNYDELVMAVEAAKYSNNPIEVLNNGTLYSEPITIYLEPGDYNATTSMTWGDTESYLFSTLKIEGNGMILDGNNSNQFITVYEGHSLYLNNITFRNYKGSNGGVICNKGYLYGNNTTFTGNVAINEGGAIWTSSSFDIKSCVFTNNKVQHLGGVAIMVTGNAIFINANSSGSIENSRFMNNGANDAPNRGTISLFNSAVNITNCEFIGESTVFDLWVDECNVTLRDSHFTMNGNIFRRVQESDIQNHIDSTNNIFALNNPSNFAKGEDNRLYLTNNGTYIPSDAKVDIQVANTIVRKDMVNNVIADYAVPLGRYTMTVVVNPDGGDSNVKNTTYVILSLTNELNISADNIQAPGMPIVPITVNADNNLYNGTMVISIDGNVVGTTEVDTVQKSTIVNIDLEDYTTGVYTLNITYTDNVTGYIVNTICTLTYNVVPQATTIAINPIEDTTYRNDTTISGTLLSNGNPLSDKNVTIKINNEELANITTENGAFEYVVTGWTVGENKVTVTYDGNFRYLSSEANSTFTVNKKESKVTINDIATVTCNDNVTISGLVTSIDGTILNHVNIFVYLNGEEHQVTTYSNGQFKTTYTTSTIGEQEVKVVYKGNTKYLASNATATFTATSAKLVMFTVKPVTYRDTYTIQGKLTDSDGNIIKGAEVQLNINGETITLTTDKNGKYTYKAQALALGNFTVTASYNDEVTGIELTATKTLEVTKRAVTLTVDEISDVTVGEEVTITGTLTDNIGTPCKNCNIYIKINGEEQHTTTNTQGIFTYTYTPTAAGTQTVTVTYKGNANYLGAKVTKTFEAIA